MNSNKAIISNIQRDLVTLISPSNSSATIRIFIIRMLCSFSLSLISKNSNRFIRTQGQRQRNKMSKRIIREKNISKILLLPRNIGKSFIFSPSSFQGVSDCWWKLPKFKLRGDSDDLNVDIIRFIILLLCINPKEIFTKAN